MKELGSLEVYRLEECLKALAEHHNHTSANFKGHFPKSLMRRHWPPLKRMLTAVNPGSL